jgi:hypothetical protein
MQHGTYTDSAGRKATLPDGPAWSEKPRHAFSVANERTKHGCQALPKNTKPSVVAVVEIGTRRRWIGICLVRFLFGIDDD